jgi:GNAT superfamily N-acetyltransferase
MPSEKSRACDSPAVRIRRADAAEVIDLRHAVLRAGLPRETAIFPGDNDPSARHFVAVAADDGRVVGTLTLHLNRWGDAPAWQLRGMAIDPGLQARGIGAQLLHAAEESIAADSPPTLQLWCNARVPARRFYEQHGWRVASDEFDVPTAGPHVKMIKRVVPSVR